MLRVTDYDCLTDTFGFSDGVRIGLLELFQETERGLVAREWVRRNLTHEDLRGRTCCTIEGSDPCQQSMKASETP